MGNMPIGRCCVCNDELDHCDAGYCEDCGFAFCWSDCGDWSENGSPYHKCNNCKEGSEDE